MREVKGTNSLEIIHCPSCHKLLPENAHYCIYCGDFFASIDAQDMRAGQEVSASAGGTKKTRPLTGQNLYRSTWTGRRITSSLLDEDFGPEEEIAAEPHHGTWQKVVETPSRPPAIHPPRPPLPPQSHSILRHMPYGHARLSPVILFWCSMIVLFFFVGGGVFGIMGTLGRERTGSVPGAILQITPSDVAVGATVNLRGSGFSPRAQLGLTRDDAIPIADTGGTTIIASQANGSFTDTLVVGPDWVSGTHTLSVEDATTHKFTSSPIQVTGMGDLLRPAHLRLSTASLDLGAGDQATNSVQKVALTNLGGGQISWKADASQPWLSISPKSGTFSSGMKTEVEIAVDRTNLQPGSFSDQVLFSSSAGDSVLPIKMSVRALPLQKNPVLQLSPAALSFTGSDGGFAPAVQGISISNPGQGTLHWATETNVPWLAISSPSGTVNASTSQQAQVSVDTSNLLPGTYSGTITFRDDGAGGVMHNLQSIAVSVTITPRCTLAIASDALSFTAAYQQSTPDAKAVNLSTANCSSSIAWQATSHASWLTVSQTNGSTPARPTIGINAAGLKPGTYTSSITFSSNSGTQEVPVRFTLSQLAEPVLSVGSTGNLSFSSMVGQGDTTTQKVTLTNRGTAALLWSAKATTGSSGNWLSLNSRSGSISAHQSTSLTVISKTLASMVPGTYSGAINVTATDQQGNAIAGSPQRINVTLNVTLPPTTPSIQVSDTTLAFSTSAGMNPAPQTIRIVNTGRNSVSWQVGTPSQSWLSVSPDRGINAAGTSSTITLSANLAGLKPGRYNAQVVLKPSSGPSILVKASLKVSTVTPTPAIVPGPAPVPTAAPQPSPTPVATPTTDPTPTPLPNPATLTAVSRGGTPPVQTVVPSPSPNPTPVPTAQPTPRPVPTATPYPIKPTPGGSIQNPVPTPSSAIMPTVVPQLTRNPVPVQPAPTPAPTQSSAEPTPIQTPVEQPEPTYPSRRNARPTALPNAR